MELTIFYAWQNDTPKLVNRFLIRDVLNSVSKSISNDALIEDSPRLDHDTLGVSGTPEITSTIFSKIKRSAVFVADVTFIGASSSSSEGKLIPNPNVMLELGFASATVGWERIVTVMNEHFGLAEQQIFDLKSRRFPIQYSVDPDSSADLNETKKQLRISLEQAVRLALRSQYEAVEDIIASLDAESLRILRMCAGWDIFWPSSGGTIFANSANDAGYRHLLSLRLIKGTWVPEDEKYEYRWTYLGIQTLIKLGMKQPP